MKKKFTDFEKEKQQLKFIRTKQLVLFLLMTFISFIVFIIVLVYITFLLKNL